MNPLRRRARGALALALLAGSLFAFTAPAGAEGSPRTFGTDPAPGAQTKLAPTPGSVFVPMKPCRVLDTRGTGALGPNATRDIMIIGGTCGVPDTATSVEASISAVTPSGNGFARVWPTGSAPSTGTVLNYSAGKGTTNTGAVAISGTGKLTLKNFSGPSQYVVDVQGFYTRADQLPSDAGSYYVPLRPCRVLDTRGSGGPLAAGATRSVSLVDTTGCDVPSGATGVEAAVSAVAPAATGYARVWPTGAGEPNATFLNFAAGQATTNTGAIAAGAGTALTLRNFGGPSNYVVDIQGYFIRFSDAGDVTLNEFHAFSPCRFFDSRDFPEEPPFGPGDYISGPVTADGTGCPIPEGATAAELSVSAAAPTSSGYTRVYPEAGGAPNATFLNYSKGQSTTNTGSVSLDGDGYIELTNYTGITDYTLDVQGAWVPLLLN